MCKLCEQYNLSIGTYYLKIRRKIEVTMRPIVNPEHKSDDWRNLAVNVSTQCAGRTMTRILLSVMTNRLLVLPRRLLCRLYKNLLNVYRFTIT